MKKLLMIACAALAVTACSKNSGGGPGEGPVLPAGKTYATFDFSFGNSPATVVSRAETDYNPVNGNDETDDVKFAAGDMRLMIFNAQNGVLEYNDVISETDKKKTLLLTAGKKKIFVFANTAKLADNSANTDDNLNKRMEAFVVGEPTSTLTNFYKQKFSAGVPQQVPLDKTDVERTFNIGNLHTIVETGAKGLPMSNTAEIEYDLKADVTEEQAKGGAPSETGVSNDNCFKIKLYFMIAKGRLVMGTNALKDGTGEDGTIIFGPKYSIKNLAVYTNYVQHWGAGKPMGYFHNTVFDSDAAFKAAFDGASTVSMASSITPESCNYVYMPENTSSGTMLRGQSTYFAINMTYKPGKVIHEVSRNLSNVLVMNMKKLDEIGLMDGNADPLDYVYLTQKVENNDKTEVIQAGTYFKTSGLLGKALWMLKYPAGTWTASTEQTNEAAAMLAATEYLEFSKAQSWYRLDIGEGVAPNIKLGVLRGNRYTATVNNITGPGVPKEEDLDDEKLKPVFTNTYIHAVIEAAGWQDVSTGGDL